MLLLNILYFFVFWFIVSELSFFLSKFTTVGTTDFFAESIFKIESFFKFTLKMDKISSLIMRASYSKVFICRPCHCFWICLIIHFFTLAFLMQETLIFAFIYSLIVSLWTYHSIDKFLKNAERQKQKRANRDNL